MDFKTEEKALRIKIEALKDEVAERAHQEMYRKIIDFNATEDSSRAKITGVEYGMGAIVLLGNVMLKFEDDEPEEEVRIWDHYESIFMREQYSEIIPVLDIIQGLYNLNLESSGNLTSRNF